MKGELHKCHSYPLVRKKYIIVKDAVRLYEAAEGELLEHRIFITYNCIFIPRVKRAFIELSP